MSTPSARRRHAPSWRRSCQCTAPAPLGRESARLFCRGPRTTRDPSARLTADTTCYYSWRCSLRACRCSLGSCVPSTQATTSDISGSPRRPFRLWRYGPAYRARSRARVFGRAVGAIAPEPAVPQRRPHLPWGDCRSRSCDSRGSVRALHRDKHGARRRRMPTTGTVTRSVPASLGGLIMSLRSRDHDEQPSPRGTQMGG